MIELSILIPTVPERQDKLRKLWEHLNSQILTGFPVEILVLMDNRKMTIGRKRQKLLESAQGEYIAFVDDDDWVSVNYVRALLEAATHRPDVIVFPIPCEIPSGSKTLRGTVESSVHFENEQFRDGGITKRKPIQIHCWRRTLALQATFPDTSRGEDFAWAGQLWDKVTTERRVDETLYLYSRERDLSEAYDA